MVSEMNPIKVSVVIPCFNHGQFLRESVASVASSGRRDVELIVVDDGSTDDCTRAEMDDLIANGVSVLRQENKGLAAARNAGIQVSSGDYILPLDADNRLRSGYFENGISVLDADQGIGVVYGDAEYIGARTGRWIVGPFNQDRLLFWNYIDACALFRRAVWVQNNGYDGTMPVQGLEDWDFWLGALGKGWKFSYLPEVTFDYRVAKESMITRTYGVEDKIIEFISRKHGLLFRKAWQRKVDDCELLSSKRRSLWGKFRDLGRRVKSRMLRKLARA
jgi:glycosyltransferase involved in cell wall biosynthesis